MDKIAIISDIHGNKEALLTVLNDIKKRNINKIICLGDIIAKGTHSHECIELIKKSCDIVLKGNCDEYFASDLDLSSKSEIEKKRIIWNKSKLTNDDTSYLKILPYSYEFYLSGRLVRLFHSTPNKTNDFIANIDKIENLYKLFLPSENTLSQNYADIVIYGHIHTQFIQKIYNRTIINVGSVGNALDIFRNEEKDANKKFTTVANYLILNGIYNSTNINDEVSYELVNLPYNIEKELNDNIDNIELDLYKIELKDGKYRDMNKISEYFEALKIDKNKI